MSQGRKRQMGFIRSMAALTCTRVASGYETFKEFYALDEGFN
jgi:hypothetical protein